MADEQEHGHKEQPIIIKKVKKGGHGGHHGGAWKVAYADFVTAMMAFFIVMWILASSEQVKQQVAAYFQDPGAFNFLTGKRTIPIDLQLQPEPGKGEGEGKGKSDQVFISFDNKNGDTVKGATYIKAIKDSIDAAKKVEDIGNTLKKEVQRLLAERPELENILSSTNLEMTTEGLRIELIESSESLFFEVGSSKLKKEALELLTKLATEIGKLPNNVEVEGHTDSRAYSGKNLYTNWELSADRANSARRILESKGLWEGQVVKVTGFADRKLRNPENPFDVTNRRISILIKQMSTNQLLATQSETGNAE